MSGLTACSSDVQALGSFAQTEQRLQAVTLILTV